jgi:hypothetical protein
VHRVLAAWLTDRVWVAACVTATFAMLLSPQGLSPFAVVAGAVPVLVRLRRDPRAGVVVASAGAAAALAVLLGANVAPAVAAASVALVFVAPFLLGMLFARTGSLNLCFQVAVLAMGLLLAIVHGVLDDPGAVWEQWLEQATRTLAAAGLKIDEAEVVASLRNTMWGSYAALALVTVLGALFLGRWWHALLAAPGSFGQEFRQLRLGKTLGVVATLILAAALFADVAVIDALAWVAVAAMAFEGLGAAHRRRADSGQQGPGWLVLIYVFLLVPPTAFIMVTVLAGWGFMDNWRRTDWRTSA